MAKPAAFAPIGVVGFDGQVELEALRLYGLPEERRTRVGRDHAALRVGGALLVYGLMLDEGRCANALGLLMSRYMLITP